MDTNVNVTMAGIEAEYQAINSTLTVQVVSARAQAAALFAEREELRNEINYLRSTWTPPDDDDSPELDD